ncbi:MAG TPA: DUF3078 domain-containing protein [Flavobacteriaceae bacterium]|nr:DUF3078 domain-containing protein [Flavobacteriaceae bacterium]
MKPRILLLIVLFSISFSGFSQTDSIVSFNLQHGLLPNLEKTKSKVDTILGNIEITYWKRKNQLGLDLNGVSYENWNAGGTDAVAALFTVLIKRTYERGNIRWNNELITRYGINVQKNKNIEKTEDKIEINSTFGYRTDPLSNWFYTAKMNLKTQFSKGYEYPNRTTPISAFMAPGYLFSGIGAQFSKFGDSLNLYFSPATHKSTWVLNQYLADRGNFGVEPAIRDSEGNIIRHGRKFRSEFGILLTNELTIRIYENVEFMHRLSLYTDYMNNFGNIDVDWDAHLNFKVNDFIRAKINTALKYDDDIKTYTVNADGEKEEHGAKIQWMQKIGIGIVLDI